MKIKPFGIDKAKEYFEKRYIEFYGDRVNERKVHCKICGKEIAKGKGNQFYFWYGEMKCRHSEFVNCNCDWYYSSNFACDKCVEELYKRRTGEKKDLNK